MGPSDRSLCAAGRRGAARRLIVRSPWFPDTCQDSARGAQSLHVGVNEAMSSGEFDRRFTDLFEQNHGEVLAYCTRRISRIEADDITAEVFAIAWRRIDEVEWATARPWLFGIARGVLANRWRSLERRSRLSEKVSGLGVAWDDSPDVVVIRREQDAVVIAALDAMKPTDREVLALAAWEELSAPEIATVLGITTSAAEQRLHRAKRRFAKVLDASPSNSQVSPRAAGRERGGR